MQLFILCLVFVGALSAEFTLPGECPDVKLQENLDYTKFSGIWYNAASFASDGRAIYDCATLEFKEDNMGYTLRETFVTTDGNRTQKSYLARVDPTFDAGNKAQFIVSHEDGDKVLQFPFYILSTDNDNYAIAYTCKSLKKKARMHYVFTWILSRSKDTLHGDTLKKMENALSKYTELAAHRNAFVFKDFTEESCSYTDQYGVDFFTTNFW
ncbi:lopap-like [Plodia interpunctella]|uniref:lopap-like n=1 Tax=Plodia interpunctella TaxID=58824 RepID=UPI0023679891|nr:lopap-like [Plodia interpunctella]XP_053614020.1 lopap-like [Plodia interpunctella]XP_053623526.1 lopap-like [Plodia interpunctella]